MTSTPDARNDTTRSVIGTELSKLLAEWIWKSAETKPEVSTTRSIPKARFVVDPAVMVNGMASSEYSRPRLAKAT
jgi:hypothetical protein